jgi:5-methylcytosine-specific restriction endonuclease McrA
MKHCRACGETKPLSEFRIVRTTSRRKDGSPRPWVGPHSKCMECERARQRSDRNRELCRARVAKRRALNPGLRVEERRREAEKAGRVYRTQQEINRIAAERREAEKAARSQRQPRPPSTRWIERMKVELPDLYDPTAKVDTLVRRARYHLDPSFKARELERAARRHAQEHGARLTSDGSLTPAVVQRLFAEAKHCPYCTLPMSPRRKTLDHIVPRTRGGWHSISNALVCCYSCNSSKADSTPEAWLGKLPSERRHEVQRLWRRIMRADTAQGFLCA